MAGKASGYKLKAADIPVVLGMVLRDDRDHDIAAWFGVNQGRIAEAKDGRHAGVSAAPAASLPPKGPPGIKGRKLYASIRAIVDAIESGKYTKDEALSALKKSLATYDTNER